VLAIRTLQKAGSSDNDKLIFTVQFASRSSLNMLYLVFNTSKAA